MVTYGTTLKLALGVCNLYKLVVLFNKKTTIKLQYFLSTILWYPIMDRILRYNIMCKKN